MPAHVLYCHMPFTYGSRARTEYVEYPTVIQGFNGPGRSGHKAPKTELGNIVWAKVICPVDMGNVQNFHVLKPSKP